MVDTWATKTAYILNDKVIPTSPNGKVYKCVTAGTSGNYLKGDTRQRGQIDSTDGTWIEDTILGFHPATWYTDVDNNGVTNIGDATALSIFLDLMGDPFLYVYEPSWPVNFGEQVVDGSVTWEVTNDSFEKGLRDKLLATGVITDLVSSRIYYARAPENAASPYIVLNLISGSPANAIDGDTKQVTRRIQFTIIDESYTDCQQIAAALKATLNGYTGVLGDIIYCQGCFLENENDLEFEDVLKVYGLTADYKFYYNE